MNENLGTLRNTHTRLCLTTFCCLSPGGFTALALRNEDCSNQWLFEKVKPNTYMLISTHMFHNRSLALGTDFDENGQAILMRFEKNVDDINQHWIFESETRRVP